MPSLESLGWDASWNAAFEPQRAQGLEPGRVAATHRGGSYDVLLADGDVRARLPGRLRPTTPASEVPVVGDWVALSRGSDPPLLEDVLPRRTKLSRRAPHDPAGDSAREQVVAANVDVVFLTFALGDPPDPRLLERYLTLAWESGGRPVVLLTKADVAGDPERAASGLAGVVGDVPVLVVSARSGTGVEDVRAALAPAPGQPAPTGALVGPSGVGKSTLVNRLAGEELLETAAVRDDGSGRHTTTRRQLVQVPGGGIVVDNPGIRQLHLWVAEGGLDETFSDIAELATQCRFPDCTHESEPGCAVREALASGELSEERLASYRELQREVAELEARLERQARSRARRRRPGAGAS